MRPKLSVTMSLAAFVMAGSFALAGCDLDVPDLNNPGLEELEDNPTPALVASACTGLLIANRIGTSVAAGGGYVSLLGILGRESYNFNRADPRTVGEMLVGRLSPSSAYGGSHWAPSYTAIRLANIVLRAAPETPGLTAEERSAIQGFAHAMQAVSFLRIIVTRDDIGAVIDTDRELSDELGPIVSREEVYAEIARLLDDSFEELGSSGEAFPFALDGGYAGFDTPTSFRRFNRALAARVAAYRGSLALDADHNCAGPCEEFYSDVLDVLGDSFITPEGTVPTSLGELEAGVHYSFGTGPGDTTNGLISPNIYVHPSVREGAQAGDARYARKVRTVAGDGDDPPGTDVSGLRSELKFTLYTSPTAKVPVIRNEELILLRAEAKWGTGDLPGAIVDLNFVRQLSGQLEPLPATLSARQVEDEILYNRRYSLLFEGGHRWIDARRFDRIGEIPLDLPDHALNIRFPLPQAECDGRPGEPKCDMSSR